MVGLGTTFALEIIRTAAEDMYRPQYKMAAAWFFRRSPLYKNIISYYGLPNIYPTGVEELLEEITEDELDQYERFATLGLS